MRRATAVGIIRVSVVGDREGDSYASPEIQRERIQQHCEREGLDLLEIYDEPNISGGLKLEKRPGLYPAIQAIESGKATVLIGAYFDRLFRSLKTQAEAVERVEDAGGRVLALDIGKVTNKTAAEWLSGTMLGAVSEYYRRSIGERILAADGRAVDRGVPPFPHIPLGYRRTDAGTLEPSSDANLVRDLFNMRAAGSSWYELCSHVQARGIEYTVTGLRELMSNRIYLGELTFGQFHNPRSHEAIVPKELFERVQHTKSQMGRQPKSDLLLARMRLVRCETCDRPMGPATWVHAKTGKRMKRYRCSSTGPGHASIDASVVDEAAEWALWEIVGDDEAWAAADQKGHELREQAAASDAEYKSVVLAFTAANATDTVAVQRLAELAAKRDADAALVNAHSPVDGIPYYLKDVVRENITRDELRQGIGLVIARIVIAPGVRGDRWSDPRRRVRVESRWGHALVPHALSDPV